jgi:hypothetical protein
MSKIQIANLQPAGVELFQGGESFLSDLQAADAHQIYGGKGYYKPYAKSSYSKSKSYAKSKKSYSYH